MLPGLPNLAKERVVTWRGVGDENVVKAAHSPYVPQPRGIGRRGVIGTILCRIKVVTDQTFDAVIVIDVSTVRQSVQLKLRWIRVKCRVSNIGGVGEVVVGTDGVDVCAMVTEAVVRGWGLGGRWGRRL